MKKKLLLALCGVFCFLRICPLYSYGYLDPSAMTYVIQVVAAITVTVTTSVGILFYKIRRFMKKKKEEKNGEKREESDEDI